MVKRFLIHVTSHFHMERLLLMECFPIFEKISASFFLGNVQKLTLNHYLYEKVFS